ncbi:MAG: DndE family protein [Candidatus Methylumidiphilus sp.]
MSEFNLTTILLSNFSASKQADDDSREISSRLGFTANYQLARLALGRSLGELDFPDSAPDPRGRTIKGLQLFGGEDEGSTLWISLLVTNLKEHSQKVVVTLEIFQKLVRDHWHRGIQLLLVDWQEAEKDYKKFVEILITRRASLPYKDSDIPELDETNPMPKSSALPIWLALGSLVDENIEARWLMNGTGYAPNIALMGQVGSGKTRTMLNLLEQARQQTNAPIILLDLGKGELANKPDLIKCLSANVLQVPEQAIPLDMFQRSDAPNSPADVLQGFRDSFQRAMQSKPGAKQLDAFREALNPLFNQLNNRITLQNIKQELHRYYSEYKKGEVDSVIATINDLIQFKLFEPEQSPEEFFQQSWIITFGNAQETNKKLSAYLLIDSLHNYLKRCQEAPIDDKGHRAIRLILAIDEARSLLAARHPGLSNLLRVHRSKGLCVMLASQSPDDYEGAADDYLEQIGLPICFRTNATSTKVLNNMFRSVPNFSALEPGFCLSVLDGTTRKVRAF